MKQQDSNGERLRLAELYANMADGELQLLAHDFGSLSPEAQDVLEFEFQRRDLTPEVDLYASDTGRDVLEWDDLVVLQQFRDLPEALLAKGSLESGGLLSENAGSAASAGTFGLKLWILLRRESKTSRDCLTTIGQQRVRELPRPFLISRQFR